MLTFVKKLTFDNFTFFSSPFYFFQWQSENIKNETNKTIKMFHCCLIMMIGLTHYSIWNCYDIDESSHGNRVKWMNDGCFQVILFSFFFVFLIKKLQLEELVHIIKNHTLKYAKPGLSFDLVPGFHQVKAFRRFVFLKKLIFIFMMCLSL